MRNVEKYIRSIKNRLINETIAGKADEILEKITADEFDYVAEGEMCECGGPMEEGECKECGKVYENEICEACGGGDIFEGECMECGKSSMYETELDEFEDEEFMRDADRNWKEREDYIGTMYQGDNPEVIKQMLIHNPEYANDYYDVHMKRKMKGEMEEGHIYELEIDEEDCMECGEMEEEDMREGNKFSGEREKAIKAGRNKFKVDGKTYPVTNESVLYRLSDDRGSELFTENEVIDLIENIVLEENKKSNIKKGPSPVGLSTYEKVHKGSGKESDDYLKSVVKKLKDYLKDGSKGDFETEPKKFPKGNGELEKMKAKKYTMSDDGKEFLDDFMHPGMEDLVPDEIQYDNEWVDDLIGGASRTGNNPEWANAEETELGDKLKKKRKAGKYKKAKDMAYRKSPQPVTDGTGENGGTGVKIKTESVNEKEKQKINEEFTRIHQLMNYSKATQ